MTTFEKIILDDRTFIYKRGIVETNVPWTKPSYEKIKEFLEIINNSTEIFKQYECYLIGGVLFDFEKTWDVDIVMTGPISDYDTLESYMNILYDIAFNQFKLLLDIQWLDGKIPEVTAQQLMSSDFIPIKRKYVKIGYAYKQIGTEISEIDLRNKEGVVKKSEYLIEGEHDSYPVSKPKLVEKILSRPEKTMRTMFDIHTFLHTDKQYFLQNTNRN
jgi:hypothetical protein